MKKLLLLSLVGLIVFSGQNVYAYPSCTKDDLGKPGIIMCDEPTISGDSGTPGLYTAGTHNWCQGGGQVSIGGTGGPICRFD